MAAPAITIMQSKVRRQSLSIIRHIFTPYTIFMPYTHTYVSYDICIYHIYVIYMSCIRQNDYNLVIYIIVCQIRYITWRYIRVAWWFIFVSHYNKEVPKQIVRLCNRYLYIQLENTLLALEYLMYSQLSSAI